MKLTTSEASDPNYLASVISLKHIRPHTNADKLMLAIVFGNQVIVSKENYEGERMVYFPVESCISAAYLSWANMFDDVALNADPTKPKGYFSSKRRVKAVKLRGEASNGIVIPVKKIAEFFGVEESLFVDGVSFDTFGDKLLVDKYIPKNNQTQGESGDPKNKKSKNK
jgi:RNA ligase (TIGR02306 family)